MVDRGQHISIGELDTQDPQRYVTEITWPVRPRPAVGD